MLKLYKGKDQFYILLALICLFLAFFQETRSFSRFRDTLQNHSKTERISIA